MSQTESEHQEKSAVLKTVEISRSSVPQNPWIPNKSGFTRSLESVRAQVNAGKRRKGGKRRKPRRQNTRGRGPAPSAGPRAGAGARAGATWGAKAGAWLGNLAQSGIMKILGMGDYTVSPEAPLQANTLINPDKGVPVMHSDAHGAIRISHREFLTDVVSPAPLPDGSPGIRGYQFVLNPADARTFPWLSALARSFTQYKLLGVCFQFKSSCGDAVSSTNSALGTVSFGTQYDVTRPLFTSKANMLNSFWSGSAKPSVDQMHCIECEPSQTPIAPLNIRNPLNTGAEVYGPSLVSSGGVPVITTFQTMADARLFDHGRMEMILTGQQASFTLGELWITYDLLLLKPIQYPAIVGHTWDGPPSEFKEPEVEFTHHAEVPLVATLSILDPAYPASLGPVD